MTVIALLLALAAVAGLVGLAAMARGRGFAMFVSACCLAMLGLYAGLLVAWLERIR